MINQYYILVNTVEELLYLVPSATNYSHCDLPAYVYYDNGLTTHIRSSHGNAAFISFDEYTVLEKMFGLKKSKDSTLFFDNELRKVFSSDNNLEEENPDKFTMIPKGTTSITEGTYLGYNEVITFINKYGEIYDFSQKCWVGHLTLVDYNNIIWDIDHEVEVYKPKLESESKKETEEPKNSLPERKDCDLVINYRNESSFYRFPSITNNKSSFQVFDRGFNEWKPSKVGPNSIFKMIEEGTCRLIHISELGMIHHGRYKFNNKFTSLFNTIETADYDKMLNQAKTVLSLLNRLK